MFVPSDASREPETQITVMTAVLLGTLAAVLALTGGAEPLQALRFGGLAAAAVLTLAVSVWHVPLAAALSCAVQYGAAVLAGVLLVFLSAGRTVVGPRRAGGAV